MSLAKYYCYTTPCLKSVPPLTCYNLDIHGLLTMIFGTTVTKKVGNQNVGHTLFSHVLT